MTLLLKMLLRVNGEHGEAGRYYWHCVMLLQHDLLGVTTEMLDQ